MVYENHVSWQQRGQTGCILANVGVG